MTHELKVLPVYLSRLKDGSKAAEVRFNDRDYQVGDECWLYRFESGQTSAIPDFRYHITHIHSGLGLQPGYVVLSFEEIIYSEEDEQ